jgi:hypothetical protein
MRCALIASCKVIAIFDLAIAESHIHSLSLTLKFCASITAITAVMVSRKYPLVVGSCNEFTP